MRFKDITEKLTLKNAALVLAVAVTAEACTRGYLKFEQEEFCEDYWHLKGESREVLEQHAAKYFGDIHPSNQEMLYNSFIRWVGNCE